MPQRKPDALVDTNVLLRFLLGDDPVQSPKATVLMRRVEQEKEQVELGDGVLAETIWVLEKGLKVPRKDIVRQLGRLLNLRGLQSSGGRRVLLDALANYGRTSCDIVDCLLAARARSKKTKVYSFDATDFKRLNCVWEEPR
jgi:predicted nucleic-acid-binding protein